LQTLYRNRHDAGPCILIIKDTNGVVFGLYSSESLHVSGTYYGSGETFVFTFKRPFVSWPDSILPPIQVFPWSLKNSFFIFSDYDYIAAGGGGSYALTIESRMLRGSSAPCMTFDNPCLASSEDFLVQAFQVWVFDDIVEGYDR